MLFRTDFAHEMLDSLPLGIPTLWVDYLTFDPSIAQMSEQEHIVSSLEHPVYHLVNSPLSGVLPAHMSIASYTHSMRDEILDRILGGACALQDHAQLIFSYRTYDLIRSIDTPNMLNI